MSINVLDKTFKVLEAVSRSTNPSSLSDITSQLEIPKPTICRILKTLQKLGYVTQEGNSNKYIPTNKLCNLGQYHQYYHLKARAMPAMLTLWKKFNETVNLAVLEGGRVRYVHFLETTQNLRLTVQPDGSDAFYSTALGRAIVSHLPQREMEMLVHRVKIKKFTPFTISDKTALLKELELTRARGWSNENEENDLGVSCFGVPLLHEGYPVAALSIAIPHSRLRPGMKKVVIDSLLFARFDRDRS